VGLTADPKLNKRHEARGMRLRSVPCGNILRIVDKRTTNSDISCLEYGDSLGQASYRGSSVWRPSSHINVFQEVGYGSVFRTERGLLV
jgi:hypothetical protein